MGTDCKLFEPLMGCFLAILLHFEIRKIFSIFTFFFAFFALV
jgi:hypothetical protein